MWKIPSFWALVLGTILFWATFAVVVNTISPLISSEIAFTAFYSVLFFALSFTITLFFTLCKKIFFPTISSYRCILSSLRQGFLIAFVLVVALFLVQIKMLSAKEILLLFLLFLFLEMLLREKKD